MAEHKTRVARVECSWLSNGRALPTREEQDLMAMAVDRLAHEILEADIERVLDAASLEAAITPAIRVDEFVRETTRWTDRDIDRITYDMDIEVTEIVEVDVHPTHGRPKKQKTPQPASASLPRESRGQPLAMSDILASVKGLDPYQRARVLAYLLEHCEELGPSCGFYPYTDGSVGIVLTDRTKVVIDPKRGRLRVWREDEDEETGDPIHSFDWN